MRLVIEEWEWDDWNIEHLALHGITPELVEDEVWIEAPKYNTNRRDRAASHLMIGPDRGGTMWTICITQVDEDPATWRAITGWRSKPHEETWYGGGTMKRRTMSEEEARKIERESADEDLWKQESVQIEARPTRTSVLSVRLPTAEFHALLQAARDANESLSVYVRKAVSMRQTSEHSGKRHNAIANLTVSFYPYTPGHEEVPVRNSLTAGAPEAKLTRVA